MELAKLTCAEPSLQALLSFGPQQSCTGTVPPISQKREIETIRVKYFPKDADPKSTAQPTIHFSLRTLLLYMVCVYVDVCATVQL